MDKIKTRKFLIPALGTMSAFVLVDKAYAGPKDKMSTQSEGTTSKDFYDNNAEKPEGRHSTTDGKPENNQLLKNAASDNARRSNSDIDHAVNVQQEKETIKTFKTEIEHLKDQVYIGKTFLLATGVVGFIALLLAIWALVKANGAKSQAKDVAYKNQKTIRALQNDIGELRQKISELYNQPIQLEPESRQYPQEARIVPPLEPVVQHETTLPAYMDFVNEYNALEQQRMSGFEAREARSALEKKFGIRAFSCSNYEQRMNHPDIPPVFSDAPSITSGDYWAMPVQDGVYAVVPNMKTYEGRVHAEGGMKEAFKSNFESGKTYNVIRVLQPAFFKKGWKLARRGELELSN